MALKTVSAQQAINLDTPSLSLIQREIGEQTIKDILILAITEVVGFFNLERNMDPSQVVLTAEFILQRYWYLRLEEIKSVFRRNMMAGKVYGRLDPNTIMTWLSEYDLERANACEDDAINNRNREEKKESVSHTAWVKTLISKAQAGDAKSTETLRQYRENQARMRTLLSPEEARKKEIEFRIFKHNYQKHKKL